MALKMREINARSSRKAKAAIDASIHNRTDFRVYPGRFLMEEPSAGWVSDVVGNGPDAKTDITDLLLRVRGFRAAVEAERGRKSTR